MRFRGRRGEREKQRQTATVRAADFCLSVSGGGGDCFDDAACAPRIYVRSLFLSCAHAPPPPPADRGFAARPIQQRRPRLGVRGRQAGKAASVLSSGAAHAPFVDVTPASFFFCRLSFVLLIDYTASQLSLSDKISPSSPPTSLSTLLSSYKYKSTHHYKFASAG